MIPEPLKVLLRYLVTLPHHDLCTLFEMVEVAVNELQFENVNDDCHT